MSSPSSQIIWIFPIVNARYISLYPWASPAANYWQTQLISHIRTCTSITLVTWSPQRPWPIGPLIGFANLSTLIECDNVIPLTYINLPFLRNLFIFISFLQFCLKDRTNLATVNSVITYNPSLAATLIANYIRHRHKLRWISIVADDEPPSGPDAYIHLSWYSYISFRSSKPSLYLEGGIAKTPLKLTTDQLIRKPSSKYIFLYSGDFGIFAGLDLLLSSFIKYKNPCVELWVCGKGKSSSILHACSIDHRIKHFGLLNQDQYVLSISDCFVNPRPSSLPENRLNFPSKLLVYLAYGKPVISTMTPGIPPEYGDILLPINPESSEGFIQAFDKAFSLSNEQLELIERKTTLFTTSKTWHFQTNRFFAWFEDLIWSTHTPN
jgi:glycosyltransferase involved in cell wall biosynthesis